MIDYYLKTVSESELNTLLIQAELAFESEETIVLADGVALDIIGDIYKATEELDAEGNPVMTKINGFHANLRVFKDLEDWQEAGLVEHNVEVSSPTRIWA